MSDENTTPVEPANDPVEATTTEAAAEPVKPARKRASTKKADEVAAALAEVQALREQLEAEKRELAIEKEAIARAEEMVAKLVTQPRPTAPADQSRQNRNIVVAAVAGVLIVAGIISAAVSSNNKADDPAATPTVTAQPSTEPQPSIPALPENYDVPANASKTGGFIVGDQSAPNKLVLWEDFSCGYCAQFEAEYAPVIEKAIAEKKVQVEYKIVSFLSDSSVYAQNAAGCAADQGKFAELHRTLYADQKAWSLQDLAGLGKTIGVKDTKTYEECVSTGPYQDWITATTATMQEAGVQGTPAVFLNGKEWDRTKSLADFASTLGVTP